MSLRMLLALPLLLTLLVPTISRAADGLTAPTLDRLWPQWQARITVQTSSGSPLNASLWLDSSSRTLQGASVLGDYVFASPSFGNFRATGGLLFGNAAGAPVLSAAAGARLGLALNSGVAAAPGQDNAGTLPYVGLGFSSAALLPSLSLNADFGWVAGQSTSLAGGGRALFGNQAGPGWRDWRVSPVLQVGLRYAF